MRRQVVGCRLQGGSAPASGGCRVIHFNQLNNDLCSSLKFDDTVINSVENY